MPLLVLLLSILLTATTAADPVFSVADSGLNANSNREWQISVIPDADLFSTTINGTGGSLAVELGFEIDGSELVGAVANNSDWPNNTPGNNPFTGTVTIGTQANLVSDTVFASLGSEFFTSATAVNILTIETLGSGMTTLSWGGHDFPEYTGSRIAQGGINFDNIVGSLTSGGSGPNGDFNSDGNWDCADIDALSAAIAANSNDLSFDMNGDGSVTANDVTDAGGWLAVGGANNPAATGGNSFLLGDANLDGVVDVSDFNLWNGAKFTNNTAWCSGNFNSDTVVDVSDFNLWNGNKFTSSDFPSVVPEPTTNMLFAVGCLAISGLLRRKWK